MADPSPHADTDDASDLEPPSATGGAPRWVKVFGIIALVLVLMLVALLLFGGGNHGPGRHLGAGDTAAPSLQHDVEES